MTPEKRLLAFEQIVRQRPREPFARYSYAMALRAVGRLEDAAAQFVELRGHSPEYVPTYLMEGQLLEALGRPREAGAAYEEGVARAAAAGNDHARSELQQALELLRAQTT